MHKVLLDGGKIELRLRPVTGFLIKGDTKGANLLQPERPDLAALRTRAGATGPDDDTVFLPGSSIKGVVRSAAERILRSIDPDRADNLAEDPLEHDAPSQKPASRRGDALARQRGRGPWAMGEVHRSLCLASRTFGSQAMAARIRFTDALPTAETRAAANRVEPRAAVSINRRTGGPGHGPFESEVVTRGQYAVAIQFENLQLWQLALLGLVLEDVDLGLVRFGSSKTRGLGAFAIDHLAVSWWQVGPDGPPAGVGELGGSAMAAAYGFFRPDRLDGVPGDPERVQERVRTVRRWSGDDAWALFRAAQGGPWAALVDAVTTDGWRQ